MTAGSFREPSFQTTYEELKHLKFVPLKKYEIWAGFQTTYEELKPKSFEVSDFDRPLSLPDYL